MRTLILFILFFSINCSANELEIHTFSIHGGYNNYLNNNNFGLGYHFYDNSVSIGGYYNSYRKLTMYATKDFMFYNFGVFAGLATGYKIETGYDISPIGGLLLTIPINDTLGLSFIYVPAINHGMVDVTHMMFTYRL